MRMEKCLLREAFQVPAVGHVLITFPEKGPLQAVPNAAATA